jgi:hypothetical protein
MATGRVFFENQKDYRMVGTRGRRESVGFGVNLFVEKLFLLHLTRAVEGVNLVTKKSVIKGAQNEDVSLGATLKCNPLPSRVTTRVACRTFYTFSGSLEPYH